MEAPIKKVLVGLDAEGNSENALRVAGYLRKLLESEIELLHAAHLPGFLRPGGELDELLSERGKLLTEVETRVRNLYSGAIREASLAEVGMQVVVGHPAKILSDRASKEHCDLVVVGAHRKRRFIDVGSTARTVLSRGVCPVWVQNVPFRPVRRILAPVDLSEHSQRAAAFAAQLGAACDAEVQVVYCFEAPEIMRWMNQHDETTKALIGRIREHEEERFEKLVDGIKWKCPHTADFIDAQVHSRIVELSDEVDLVVMGTHGRTALGQFVLGSVTVEMLGRARCAVLAIKEPEKVWEVD